MCARDFCPCFTKRKPWSFYRKVKEGTFWAKSWQLGAQALHLLIDRLLNLGQRRIRMRYSPLRHSGNDLLSLFFPVLLQVFGLHLGSLFLTLRTTPFLF
jgi:hypothetical protein